MKRLPAIIIALLCVCGLLAACGGNKKDDSKDLITIETEYVDLRYPSKWEDKIKTDILDNSVYTVRFNSDGKNIFDITFNKGDTMLGTLKTDDGDVSVYVRYYELDKNDKNYQDYAAMQDDVNIITENLAKDYDFSIGAPLLEDDGETFAIETKVATLYYPQRWKDTVTVETDDKGVAFSCDGTPLFTISFGSDEGDLLGTYDGTELRLETFDFDKKKLSAKQISIYEAMQEDVNVILQNLYSDKKFKLEM